MMSDLHNTPMNNHVSKDKMKIVSQSRGLQATGLGKSFLRKKACGAQCDLKCKKR